MASKATAENLNQSNPVTYPHAPIVEAILDIQVKFPLVPPQSQFKQFANGVSSQFPHSLEVNPVQVKMAVPLQKGEPLVDKTFGPPSGFRLTTAHNDRVLQILPRGMTFSHLPPYTDWMTFRAEAVPLWERYVELVNPKSVTRVALRYINVINIPRDHIEIMDYFNFYPHLPEEIPQAMSGLYMQVQMPQTDLGTDVTAIVNFGLAGPVQPNVTKIVLDVDISATRDIFCTTDDVFNLLDTIRNRKNHVFEASITDNTRELFK